MNFYTIKLVTVMLTSLLLMGGYAQALEKVEFGKADLTYHVYKDINKMADKVVKNEKGDELGKIETILITSPDSIQYVVVLVGGFLGIGDKLVTVPIRNLKVASDGSVQLRNVTKKELENAPAFDYKKAGIINRRFPQYGPDQH